MRMLKTNLNNGKYELYLPEHRAQRPEWSTGWEVKRIDSMVANVKKGDVVLDIGTEEGDISALLAKYCKCEMILFEPNKLVWSNIKAIWEANKLPIPKSAFVGFASAKDKFKEKDWIKDMKATGWGKHADGKLIPDHGFKELSDPGEISQIKLDTFMGGDKVDMITIDVEGSEWEVLKGTKKILKEQSPLVYVSIHPESMHHYFGQYTVELIRYMKDLTYGYEILEFDHEFHFLFKKGTR